MNTPAVQPTDATGSCRAPGKIQKAVETTQVQFKEMNQQHGNGCSNIQKIPKTVEIVHAVIQGQVPNIAKTDEIPKAQFMPRRCTTNQLCRDSAQCPGDSED